MIAHARPEIAGRLAAVGAAELARDMVAGIDATSWDEAVSATRALTALVDQRAATNDASAARKRLTTLRALLEFPEGDLGGRRVRFDGPQGHDPVRVRVELQAIAESLAD